MQCVQWFVRFAKFCTSACKYNSLNVNNMQESLTKLDDLHCQSKFLLIRNTHSCRAHNDSNPDISVCLLCGRSGDFGSTKTSS